jgi:hypothetical protein
MKIIATFANRKHDPEVVELVTAWDEYSVDENMSGWQEDKVKSLASWGDDLLNSVDVEIELGPHATDLIEAHLSGKLSVAATSVKSLEA